eukprot:TRINITY_DN12497_c0_g1_i5.p1 TRINITY_DN12497_c0_g1~~TRINITY_DN12497_c0_g1_i5.p1  ORF type:complete len:203 (-),score=52.30 TRINITY_DN12497_c0_g1_i5:275-883(-)
MAEYKFAFEKAGTKRPALVHNNTSEKFDETSEDLYLRDARRHYQVIQEHRLHSTDIHKFITATVELIHLCWLGGELVQEWSASTDLFHVFLELISTTNSMTAKQKIIECIGVCARKSRPVQDTLCRLGWIPVLANLLKSHDQELRKWTCVCLFYVLLNNAACQSQALAIPDLKERLQAVAGDDWKLWKYNDAEEVMRMLDMM